MLMILQNPWSKAITYCDAENYLGNFDAYVQLIDDDVIDTVNDLPELKEYCDRAAWLAAWAKLVGPEDAGRIILGS